MTFSEAEARIRRLTARLAEDERRMADVQDKILKARQDIGAFRGVGAGTCLTTFYGRVAGFDLFNFSICDDESSPYAAFDPCGGGNPSDGYVCTSWLANSTIRAEGVQTGVDYGTWPAADGTFSFSIPILNADTDVKFYASGPAPWFAEGAPYTQSIDSGNRCNKTDPAGNYIYPDVNQCMYSGVASGYAALPTSFRCQYPVPRVLTCDHDLLGSGLIATLTEPSGWQTLCQDIATYASGSCAAGTGTYTSIMDWLTLGLDERGFRVSGTSCPTTTTDCYGVGHTANWIASLSVSRPSPGANFVLPTPSNPFSITYSKVWTGTPLYYPVGTYTIRFYETRP